MIAADIYRPDEWHDFFVMTGGGAAALTGLVFVALSLNIHVMAEDATHRYRAIGTLAGLTSVFMICGLALMGGQDHRAIGAEPGPDCAQDRLGNGRRLLRAPLEQLDHVSQKDEPIDSLEGSEQGVERSFPAQDVPTEPGAEMEIGDD